MKYAIAKLQRSLFVVLLYSTAVFATICDQAGITNRTPIWLIFEIIMLLLGVLSFSDVPRKMWYIIFFILGGIGFNFTYTAVPIAASINGVREILMVLAMAMFYFKIFATGNEQEAMRYVNIMKKFGWFFLFIQAIPVAIQYKQFGPTDYVGGSYGWFSTGNLTLAIICIVFFLFQFSEPSWKKLMLLGLMYPLMLNETKISFILIPMMIVFIFFEPKAKNVIMAGVGAAIFLLIFNSLYRNEDVEGMSNMSDIFSADFLNEYLMADFETHPDVPRITKIILAYNLIAEDVRTLFFGMEFGLFRGSNTGDVSKFAQTYSWLLGGTRPYLFFLLLQGGIVLVTGIFWLIFRICNFFRDANKQSVFYFIIFFMMLFYSDSLRWHNFVIVFFFLMFFVNSNLFKSKEYLYEDSYRLG